jgi:hypothetical protein
MGNVTDRPQRAPKENPVKTGQHARDPITVLIKKLLHPRFLADFMV